MDLRRLEYLVGVVDHGGFTRAAAALHVSQPALSHGIGALEAELGVGLFSRVGRTVSLTDAGHRTVAVARRVLAEAAELQAVASSAAAAMAGTLTVAALPTLSTDLLAGWIGEFRAAYPAVAVRISEPEGLVGVEQAVRSGRADLGVTDLTTGATGLRRIEVVRQQVVAICPPGRVAGAGPLTASELAALPLVATPEGTSMRRLLDRVLQRAAVPPSIAVEVDNREAIVPLVLAGAGASLVPERAAAFAAERGAVVRPLRPAVTRRVGIIQRPGRPSPVAAALTEIAIRRGCGA